MIRTYTVNSTLKLENKESAVITIILKGENISIDYALENGDYNILVFNDSESDVNLEESGFIKNGSLKISYIELNNFKYRQHNTLEVYKDSSLTVDSIYLGINNKEINFDLLNKEGYSSVEISNNVVCLKDSESSAGSKPMVTSLLTAWQDGIARRERKICSQPMWSCPSCYKVTFQESEGNVACYVKPGFENAPF